MNHCQGLEEKIFKRNSQHFRELVFLKCNHNHNSKIIIIIIIMEEEEQ